MKFARTHLFMEVGMKHVMNRIHVPLNYIAWGFDPRAVTRDLITGRFAFIVICEVMSKAKKWEAVGTSELLAAHTRSLR